MNLSTDFAYRETPDKAYRIQEVVQCCGRRAHRQQSPSCGSLGFALFTADSLQDLENYDQRDWGCAFEKAPCELCLEMVHHL